MAQAPSIDVQIFECKECGSLKGDLGIKRPLNSLEGRVVLSSEFEVHITTLRFALQGHQNSRVVAYVDDHTLKTPVRYHDAIAITNSHRFLNVVYHPALASAVQTKSPSGSHQWSSDFAFLIPEITDRLTAGSPEICELLPPSFISGPLFPRLSGRPNPRSDVIYSLHVTVEYMHRIGTEGLSGSWKRLEHEQQFDFLPYIEVQSPTNIGSFPLEFITHINIPVWRSFLGGYLGSIELATSEPEPLKYASVSSPASTYCVLTFSIGASPRIYRRLRKLEIKIQPLVRAKTYYTTEEIHCPPRQTSLTHQGLLRLQDSVMRLPPESFSAITWRYLPVGQSETAGELPPLYSESAMPLPLPPPSMTGSGEAGIFRASIILAVQPVEALLPTFCSHLMARSYTLLMKLLMNGLYCKAVDLEVPLQVAYPRPTAQADDPSPNSSLERRDSRCRGVKRLLGEDKILPLYTVALSS